MSLPPAIPRPISRPCLKMSIGLLLPNNCDRTLGLLPEENESLADGSCCRLPKPPLPWDDALISTGRNILSDFGSIQRAHVDVHAGARLDDVDHHQTDQQCNGRNDFEVEQRVTAGLADRFHALHARDTADDGAEDDRRDDHFDQFDEPVTQWLEGHTGLRVEVTDQDADGDGNDHLEIQGFVQWLTSRSE